MIQKAKKQIKIVWKNYQKRKQDNLFNNSIGLNKEKIKSRDYYRANLNAYGKVMRVSPKKLFKKCLLIDTLIPATFFIPVVFASIVFIFSFGKEFIIDLEKKQD